VKPRAINEQIFREDLCCRLKVVRIQTPPLRSIAEDTPVIGKHFFAKHCQMMNIPLKEITSPALACLSRRLLPGNTRPLENENKPPDRHGKTRSNYRRGAKSPLQTETPPKERKEEELSLRGQLLNDAVQAFERRSIEDGVRNCNGNKQKAAQALGLSRQCLIKIKKLK
jgi:two-component system response regulator HydG